MEKGIVVTQIDDLPVDENGNRPEFEFSFDRPRKFTSTEMGVSTDVVNTLPGTGDYDRAILPLKKPSRTQSASTQASVQNYRNVLNSLIARSAKK